MINLMSHNTLPKLISAGLAIAIFATNAPAHAKSHYVKNYKELDTLALSVNAVTAAEGVVIPWLLSL
jgi:hypothetical protein